MAKPYCIEAAQLGDTFVGNTDDLRRFADILTDIVARDHPMAKRMVELGDDVFIVRVHIEQPADAITPTDAQWQDALDRLASERPHTFK